MQVSAPLTPLVSDLASSVRLLLAGQLRPRANGRVFDRVAEGPKQPPKGQPIDPPRGRFHPDAATLTGPRAGDLASAIGHFGPRRALHGVAGVVHVVRGCSTPIWVTPAPSPVRAGGSHVAGEQVVATFWKQQPPRGRVSRRRSSADARCVVGGPSRADAQSAWGCTTPGAPRPWLRCCSVWRGVGLVTGPSAGLSGAGQFGW